MNKRKRQSPRFVLITFPDYASACAVHVGDTLVCDGGYRCMPEDTCCQVRRDVAGRLFVLCDDVNVHVLEPYEGRYLGFYLRH